MTAVFRKNHGGTEVKIFSYLYDAEGRVSKVTDHMGGTSHLLFYDFLGRLCQADGSDEIRMDKSELKYAEWVRREDIVLQPDDYSLTNEMMLRFKEGREGLA